MKAPEKIYLQVCGDCKDNDCKNCKFEDLEDNVTWCKDEIFAFFVENDEAFDVVFAVTWSALPVEQHVPVNPGAGAGVDIGHDFIEIRVGGGGPIGGIVRRKTDTHFGTQQHNVWIFLANLPHFVRKSAGVPVIAKAGDFLFAAVFGDIFAVE